MNILQKATLVLMISASAVWTADADDCRSRIEFESIDVRSGLPSNEIMRIHKDREGMLWFASNNGTIRYDGYEFKMYRNSMNTQYHFNDNLTTALADDERRIWIGSHNGLSWIDKKTHEIFSVDDPEISRVRIHKILPAADGMTLVGTSYGMFVITEASNGELKVEKKKLVNDNPNQQVMDILQDSAGRIWLGIGSHGLYRYDPVSGECTFYMQGECKDFAHVLYESRDGSIWIGSWGRGLYRMEHPESPETAVYTNFKPEPGDESSISSNVIYSICEDRLSGDLWIGGRNGLSIMYRDEKGEAAFDRYIFDGSVYNISNNDVSDIYQDEYGTMWIATVGGGLNKARLKESRINHDNLAGIAKDFNTRFITASYADGKGNLWLGLKNKGLVIYDFKSRTYRSASQIKALKQISRHAKIKCICPINGGKELLLSAEDIGIYRIRLKDGIPFNCSLIWPGIDRLFPSGYISTIFQDSRGRIWISSGRSICTTDADLKLIRKHMWNGVTQSQVTVFNELPDGDILAGTRSDGILRIRMNWKDPEYKLYGKENEQFRCRHILSIHVGKDGKVLVGTAGEGLFEYDKTADRFIPANEKYNIPYDDIFNIFEDSRNALWACTHDAIIKLEPHNSKTFQAAKFPWNNVFVQECRIQEIAEDNFVIGGMNGLTYFDTNEQSTGCKQPPLVITDIVIGYKSIYDNPKSKEDKYKYENNSLILPHDNKNFSVKFASLSYETPPKDQYAFILEGYEKDWNYSGTEQRIASYRNLKKGRYTLLIKSAGMNGEWLQEPVRLNVRVLPSIFDTWYAYLIYILAAGSIISYVTFLSWKKIRLHNQLKISELDKKKNEELNMSKLRFFTNISHEFLTPLTIISCAAENMAGNGEDKNPNLEIIKGNVSRLQNLVHQVLDFNKAESNKLELKVNEGNLSEMLRSICCNGFDLLAKEQNIILKFKSSQNVRGWYDADKVDKIMNNLLSNAFKYNYENSYVTVTLTEDYDEDRRYAVIVVKDGGIGIAPDKIGKIFDRYYEMDYREVKSEGTGIGMALTKALIDLHKGKIEVQSAPGSGTTFTVTLPINEGSYSEEEREPKSHIIQLDNSIPPVTLEDGKHILIVEDNTDLRFLMKQNLSQYFIVETACNGAEAIEKLKGQSFDIVVTDVMMPEMDGNQLCSYIKNNIDYSHIPVILLTAKSSDQDKIIGYENGADAFISKPFQMQLLLSRILNLLKGKELMANSFNKNVDTIQLQSIQYTPLDKKFIENAISIVEENISNEEFNMESLATAINVSKSTLYRKIKSLTGMSINEFIKDIRLKQACQIMKKGSINVAEVAYLVGFDQPKYFTYCFKKKYGFLPSEFIEQNKEQNKEQKNKE